MTDRHPDRFMLPESLTPTERDQWDRMTAAQRVRAAERMSAFQAWRLGSADVNTAVIKSGLSRSRFYRLAAEWRAAPSLAALGATVGPRAAKTRLDPQVVNDLQATVPGVVRFNAGATVSQLVRLLVEAGGIDRERMPSAVKLREIVEAELRRVAATHEAGNALQLDCSALNLPGPDGRPHILFVCIDPGTRLILGAAVTDAPDARRGYAAAARDGLARLSDGLAILPWARRLVRVEMTAGADLDASGELLDRLVAAEVGANLQLARVPRRYGRYMRRVVGVRLGRIEITPARTETGSAISDNGDMTPWSEVEADAAVARAVDDHNGELLPHLREQAHGQPPLGLLQLLEALSSQG